MFLILPRPQLRRPAPYREKKKEKEKVISRSCLGDQQGWAHREGDGGDESSAEKRINDGFSSHAPVRVAVLVVIVIMAVVVIVVAHAQSTAQRRERNDEWHETRR